LNYWTNKEERIDINTSLRSFQGLNAEAQSHLTTNFLLQIDKEARDTRQGIFRRMRTVMLLLLVGLLVLVLLAVTVGPFIYLFTSRTDSPFLKIALPLLSALGGIIFKQGIAPWLLSYAAGEHYLETAAKSVAETLKAQNAPAVPYIIFGHNHDPDIVKVISERPLTWYVNTGSWLYSQGVVEDWLQQTKYHSFLKIIPDKIGTAPELRFWNATTKSAERIRMRH
jgi:UDP-2,3-diacylglucosamine pyrophosphatase LpxH